MFRKFLLSISTIFLSIASTWAFPVSTYSSSSKLASGRWVKIATSAEGIYQLTYSRLQALGFDDPSKVNVFGYGGVALPAVNSAFLEDFPDDVQPVPTVHTSDNRILFYGEGDARVRAGRSNTNSGTTQPDFKMARNLYDTKSYYFLSDCDVDSEAFSIAPVESDPSLPLLTSHIHVDFVEEEIQNLAGGGAIFQGPSHSAGETVPYTFAIKDFAPSAKHTDGSFYFKYAISSTNSSTLEVTVPSGLTKKDPTYNYPALVIDPSIEAYAYAFGYVNFTATKNTSGNFTFNVKIPKNSTITACAEDFVVLRYPRANRMSAASPWLLMNIPEGENALGSVMKFENVTPGDFQVWRVDTPIPSVYSTDFNAIDNTASIVLDGATSAVVSFIPSASYPSPTIVGEIENQNIHALPTPDMLIITLADHISAANDLAELHRLHQGLNVLVLDQEQVFNEFSSGTRDAMAYRRLAKMFYDRNSKKFKNLMFIGPAYFDNRCITAGNKAERLLCFEQDNPSLSLSHVTNYATDAYFGMLADTYDHNEIHMERMQINVGRLSTLNPGETAVYVDKVRDWFENPVPADVHNTVLLLAGQGDYTKHSTQCNEVVDTLHQSSNPNISISKAYTEQFAKTNDNIHYNAISSALHRGVGLLTYIGHGSRTYIDKWSVNNVQSTPYTYAPFVMFSSCDQFAFDLLGSGLVETMLTTRQGGAIAGVAANRSVYIEQNQKTCVPVSKCYAEASVENTFGDIYRQARDIVIDEYYANPAAFPLRLRTFRNLLSYNFAGDPALPVGAPTHSIKMTAINGNSPQQSPTVYPFEKSVFKGTVQKNSAIDPNFSGEVKVEIIDGAKTIYTNNYNSESNYVPLPVQIDNESLAVGYGSVKNGNFTVEMVVPTPGSIADKYRMSVSAKSDKGTAFATVADLSIGEFKSDEYDPAVFGSPQIKDMYADDPSFIPGSEIEAKTTIYAVIDPSEAGLVTMTSNVNTPSHLNVDGITKVNNIEQFMTRRSDGCFDLELPITSLSEGYHNIELCVSSNTGMVDRRAIEVIVSTRNLRTELAVEESPATTMATFSLDSDVNAVRLVITDASGNTVRSVSHPSFPYEWNLKAADGSLVPDGLYSASVLVKKDNAYGASNSVKVVVLHAE